MWYKQRKNGREKTRLLTVMSYYHLKSWLLILKKKKVLRIFTKSFRFFPKAKHGMCQKISWYIKPSVHTSKQFSLSKSQPTWNFRRGPLHTHILAWMVSGRCKCFYVWISLLPATTCSSCVSVPTRICVSGWVGHVPSRATVPLNLSEPCVSHKKLAHFYIHTPICWPVLPHCKETWMLGSVMSIWPSKMAGIIVHRDSCDVPDQRIEFN